MKNYKNRKIGILIAFIVIILTIATAYVSFKQKNSQQEVTASEIPVKQYVCSMHPQVVQDSPGDCPICGMFLIEKIAEDKNSMDSTLNDVVRHVNRSVLASVATVKPEHASLAVSVEATGIITCDPGKIRTISAKFGGVIEKSFIKYQFQPLRKGQKIYQIYCPDIYIDRWNYVNLIQAYPDKDNLTVEAREWFRLLGLTQGQIDSLKKASKPDYHLLVYSDADGYVVSPDFNPDNYFSSVSGEEYSGSEAETSNKGIELTDGLTINKGALLFRVIDPSSLRADLKVRTDDIMLLKEGQKVILSDNAIPGYNIKGIISQIEPLNGGLFQIVKVYIKDNSKLMIPGRQINARIITDEHQALWLPETAVLDLGYSHSVFALQEGKYVAKVVTTGIRCGEKVEIISGLSTDSEVALNGSLLVDSDGFIDSEE